MRLIGALAAAFIVIGLIGGYSYLYAYDLHRGFAPVKRIPGLRAGRLEWVHFYSSALRRRADYLVYLPTGYTPDHRYPVFYLLHGAPGAPQNFITIVGLNVRLDNLIKRGLVRPMILVFPDGRVDGDSYSDTEWANTATGRYADYVLDVVADVDARFSVIADRDARVIGGYSAGSTGALNIVLRHPGQFASLEAWSGPFVEVRAGPFANAAPGEIDAWSPLDYARNLKAKLASYPMQAFLYGGRSDGWSWSMPQMAQELATDGVHVHWAFYPGGHDWQLWNAHANQMLIVASGFLARHPRPATPRATQGSSTAAVGIEAALAAGENWPVLIGGLLLALVSAAAINLGFLFQSRGLRAAAPAGASMWSTLRAAVLNLQWLGGQALGWTGFAAQVIAVAIAPLSLVEAFAAGGLALSVPLAATVFGRPIDHRQRAAVFVIAAALASLPIGLASVGDHLRPNALIAASIILSAMALPIGLVGTAALRAIAAGLLYGVADGAIKAVSTHWGSEGTAALWTGWTAIALLATFGGFLAFQAALRAGSAIAAISLMTALTTLVALALGLIAFGESLGRSPALVAVHAFAVMLVLACVPVLAAAHTEMADHARASTRSAPARDELGANPGPVSTDDRRQGASDREQDRFEQRTEARTAAPQDVTEPEVPGESVGRLRRKQEHGQADHQRARGAP